MIGVGGGGAGFLGDYWSSAWADSNKLVGRIDTYSDEPDLDIER